MRSVARLSLLIGLLLQPQRALAGPWTRDPGRFYVKLAQSVFAAEGYRDQSGSFNSDTRYLGLTTSLYGEVGLLPRLQSQLYLPFVVGINTLDPSSSLQQNTVCDNGRRVEATMRRTFGDALLGLQWSPSLLSVPHAVRANVKLPLYDVGRPHGACGALFPQPGDGQLDVDLWVSLGDSLGDGRFFVFAELGHRIRSELYFATDIGREFAETFLAFAQGGWRFLPDSYLMLNLDVSVPYASDGVSKGFVSAGLSLIVPVGGLIAFEAAIDATPWAQNSAAGRPESLYLTSATLGVSGRLD